MVMNFLDAAADLVSLGFKVFPLVSGRKLPLIKAWQRQASDELEVITAWADRWPDANIGIATGVKSGVIVIDVDKKECKDGQATLDALTKKGRTLPSSPIVLTPTGGRHHFYRAVPGIKNVVEMQGRTIHACRIGRCRCCCPSQRRRASPPFCRPRKTQRAIDAKRSPICMSSDASCQA
jgi:Bifunctional DNA primase/polymerase, N-terminal